MATTVTVYTRFREEVLRGHDFDWNNDTIKAALVTNVYTPNRNTDDYWDDVVANELAAGSGYTTGGVTLSSKSVTLDAANNRVLVDAADPQWTSATFTAKYLVIYKSTGVNSTSLLVAYVNLDDSSGTASKSVSAGTFTVQFSTSPSAIFAL